MRKLIIALLVLSGNNYAHGMLRKVARALSRTRIVNRLGKVSKVAQLRLFHGTRFCKELMIDPYAAAEADIRREESFKFEQNKFIEGIQRQCKQIGIIFKINHGGTSECKVKKEKDDITCYVPTASRYGHYEYLIGKDYLGDDDAKARDIGKHNVQLFFQQCKELGIAFNNKTKEQNTLLHLAAQNCLYLLDIYLDNETGLQEHINDQNIQGDTALHLLAANKDLRQRHVRRLMYRGAQTNIQNNNGDTPLHKAVRCVNHQVVKDLVEPPANGLFCEPNLKVPDIRNIKNNKGEIPYDYVKNLGDEFLSDRAKAIKELLSRKA